MLPPHPALHPLDDDSASFEVDVASLEQRHFTDAQAVVVDQRKDGSVARVIDACEERPQL